MSPLFVLAQTTTTEVERVVGESPPWWVPVGAGLAVLVLILVVGWLYTRRRTPDRP